MSDFGLTHLRENVHYETVIYEPGKFTRDEYCVDEFAGKTTVLRRLHPDVADADLENEGKRIKQKRMARNARSRRQQESA